MMRLALPTALLLAGLGCGHPVVWPSERPAAPCEAGAFGSEPLLLALSSGGRTRRALVWAPPGPGPHDVVVSLHEFRSDPVRQQHYTRWLEEARRSGAILVAPDGKSATWNAGPCCGSAQEHGVDDVAFLDAVVARVDAVGCTTGRVLATGIGNGGMMAERWACESDVPDAVVSVGGSLQLPACPAARPVPWLHYHGELDDFAPVDGGEGRLPTTLREGHLPADHARSLWGQRNRVERDTVRAEGALTCTIGEGAAPTVSCRVAGMPDRWPGAAGAEDLGPDPLADATAGAWAWVRAAWARAAAPPEEVESTEQVGPAEASEDPAAVGGHLE